SFPTLLIERRPSRSSRPCRLPRQCEQLTPSRCPLPMLSVRIKRNHTRLAWNHFTRDLRTMSSRPISQEAIELENRVIFHFVPCDAAPPMPNCHEDVSHASHVRYVHHLKNATHPSLQSAPCQMLPLAALVGTLRAQPIRKPARPTARICSISIEDNI